MEPIIAQCTPRGSGAIALVRICGDGAIELVENFIQLSGSKKKLSEQDSHTIHHGYVVNKKQRKVIDEVLFFLMRNPKTFTGEDTVEISCHNNQFIINQIIKIAIENGAQHAQRGEFSRRAFLNNKIDLLQAEAIHDLITAQNEAVLKKSMSQLNGTLSSYTQKIEDELLSLLGAVEASFEFLDQEQRDLDFDNMIREKLDKLITRTNIILSNFSQQQQIRQGVRVSIIGNTNVGKSTLFNTLVDQERAIVTDMPGTTRDAIETTRYHDGNFWLMIDTAGLRSTKNKIEQKGIDRSWQEAAQSDIIPLVFDSAKKMTKKDVELYKKIEKLYAEKIIMIANKIDTNTEYQEQSAVFNDVTYVSAKKKIGIKNLVKQICKKIEHLFSESKSPFLLNQRQHDLLAQVNTTLKSLKKQNIKTIHYELFSHNLKKLIELTSQLMGKTINEQMMDKIFDSFCVGK